MAKTIFNFNSDAYLKANPDVAKDRVYGADPYQHYMDWGQKEGREALFDKTPVASDPSLWEAYTGYAGTDPYGGEPQSLLQDKATGNLYSKNYGEDFYQGYGNNIADNYTKVASGDALSDKYIAGLGLSPKETEEIYQNYLKDPASVNKDLINRYSDYWYNAFGTNSNVAPIDQTLNELKERDPLAYYENLAERYGRRMGWEIGQNRSDRNPELEKQLMGFLPEMQKAGLSLDQVKELVGGGMNQGNTENQRRIANLAASGGSGFNFQKDILPGLIFVGGSAAGMYGIDQAMMAYQAAQLASAAGGTSSALMGPTYAELGYTGLAEGMMGPTYAELGYTGLNLNEAISAADMASNWAQLKEYGSTAKKTYDNTKKAKQLVDALTGGGKTGTPTGGAKSADLASLLALLAPASSSSTGASLYRSGNPFTGYLPDTTVVDLDKPEKTKEQPNFGLANLLKDFNNYG